MELLGKSIFGLLLAGVIIAGCGKPPPLIIDSAVSDCDWNQGGGNANRASYIPSISSDSASLLWYRDFKRRLTIEPTAAYGKILIPLTNNKLYVLSDSDGSRLAKRKYKNPVAAPVNIYDSLAVLLIDGEKLMVENWIVHQTLWEAELDMSFTEPLVMNGNIFWIDGRNFLRCHRLIDGVRIWDKKLEGHYSSAIAGTADHIIITSDAGEIYCLESNSGQVKWKFESKTRIRNAPVIINGCLVYCGAEGHVGELRFPDGSVVWETDLKSPVMAPMASDGEGVYIGTNDRHIYRLDFESGEIIWKKDIGGPVKAGPTLTEKLAVFVSIDYRIYFADKSNGDILYRFKTGGMLTTRPLACDGRIYIAGEDRRLYCFDIAGEN